MHIKRKWVPDHGDGGIFLHQVALAPKHASGHQNGAMEEFSSMVNFPAQVDFGARGNMGTRMGWWRNFPPPPKFLHHSVLVPKAS